MLLAAPTSDRMTAIGRTCSSRCCAGFRTLAIRASTRILTAGAQRRHESRGVGAAWRNLGVVLAPTSTVDATLPGCEVHLCGYGRSGECALYFDPAWECLNGCSRH
jgi:hypothetical protein